jgi:subtilase family serine protease
VLTAALAKMKKLPLRYLGTEDVYGYGLGSLWRKGIDGAGTTVAVIEGWNYKGITRQVDAFDRRYGLPNPHITTIYPTGKLPKKCPPGMEKLGSYGACWAWAFEMAVDVLSVHLMAPYANIVISATPADTEMTDDPASQVAPPEMMNAVEYIARKHLANVISISDGTGESSYRHGVPEILAQNPGELAAAAAGIPLLVATGDCGVVQNLPSASVQCGKTTTFPDISTWDDSPWVTAVGGSTPVVNSHHRLARPPTLWHVSCCSSSAGFSKIFTRPAYQDRVAGIIGSSMRSTPDITMDGTDGTSEASPLFAGVLALATQENHGNLGPINPVLYGSLGPRGTKAGIVDVIGGNDSVTLPDNTVVPGFTAVKGFDVASGWGTVSAPVFVPSLVAATRADHQEGNARHQARAELIRLERAITVTPARIARGSSAHVVATGFLPMHLVRIYIGDRYVAKVRASAAGIVSYILKPSTMHLGAGRHRITITGMLLTAMAGFRTS